jgi:hypothetical protein
MVSKLQANPQPQQATEHQSQGSNNYLQPMELRKVHPTAPKAPWSQTADQQMTAPNGQQSHHQPTQTNQQE